MLKCANIFSDYMVIQRDKNFTIWGWANYNDTITVTIDSTSVEATADRSNGWSIVLPPMSALDCTCMTVKNSTTGETITFNDIAIGEVWLAGGQSNMEFELQNSTNATKELNVCHSIKVRSYNVPRIPVVDDYFYAMENSNQWQLPNSENCRKWSAVAYYFAKSLSQRLGVTIGIINCNLGGTSGSAWVSRDMLLSNADTKVYIDEYEDSIRGKSLEQQLKDRLDYLDYVDQWQPKINEFYSKNPNGLWGDALAFAGECKYPGPINSFSEFRPCGMYSTMIKRVAPYSIAGFIYYQGESDDHRPNSYYTLLNEVITQWRSDWNDYTLPFLIVQLPLHMERGDVDRKHWCPIRKAQFDIHKTVKNTGLAVILECGEYGNIHPLNKEPVGYRLYLQALYHVYRLESADNAYGAMFSHYTIKDGGIYVYFDYATGGFKVTNSLDWFELSEDGVNYYSANATILQDNSIFLKCNELKHPIHARYLWTNYTTVSLYTKRNNLPVAPFDF